MPYYAPQTLEDALKLKDDLKSQLKPIAGGTDLMVAIEKGRLEPPPNILNVLNLKELDFIEEENEWIHIGAVTNQTKITEHPLVKLHAPALIDAIVTIGGRQIRNMATLAGNIVNASPAADTVPVLVALDAQLQIQSSSQTRSVSVREFITGVGKTQLSENELVTRISFKKPAQISYSVFKKLGKRASMNIAAANSVVRLDFDSDKKVNLARVVLGSVFPTPLVIEDAQQLLEGQQLSEDRIKKVAQLAQDASRPISDVRASAEYRKAIVEIYIRRSLNEIWELVNANHS